MNMRPVALAAAVILVLLLGVALLYAYRNAVPRAATGELTPSPSTSASATSGTPSASQTTSAAPRAASGGIEVFATGALHGSQVWVVRSETVPGDPVTAITESLYVVPADGGTAKLVVRRVRARDQGAIGGYAASGIVASRQISPDGTKLVLQQSLLGTAAHDGLVVVDLVNGKITEILRGDMQPDLMPAWSPDAARIAFTRRLTTPSSPDDGLWVANADGTGVRRVFTGACCAQQTTVYGWTVDGSGIASAVTFEGADYLVANATTGAVTGPHGQVFGLAPASWRLATPQFVGAFSEGDKGGEQRIDVADRIGAPTRTIWHEPSDIATGQPLLMNARWNPSGNELLYIRSARQGQVMRISATGGTPTEVPLSGQPFRAEWLPDGRIVVITVANGIGGVVHVLDGTTQKTILSFPEGAGLNDISVRVYP
ncbi:MAG: hypothetical protein M3R54_08455 [Chloroflexota bacterium]|nr:hypothetical protein [Chloroflexota bacterium]